MIDHSAARSGLAQMITAAALPEITVQRAGIDAVAVFPSVVIGQPRWRTVDQRPYRFDLTTFPIAVVVARSSDDSQVIDQLEDLWPRVVEIFRTGIESDPTLGGICGSAEITEASFGRFAIQGTDYPAQLIFIELNG